MGLSIGQLAGFTAIWHRNALTYLKATTLADRIINGHNPQALKDSSLIIHKTVTRPFEGIPYSSITVRITIPSGKTSKTITFVGGRAEYDTHT